MCHIGILTTDLWPLILISHCIVSLTLAPDSDPNPLLFFQMKTEGAMPLNEREREIVKTLNETRAVDFEAIGRAVAQFGPTAAFDFDYEPILCGTMRWYIHLYRLPVPTPDVNELTQTAE